MKTILTDCDGVLLDWETAYHSWMAQHGYSLVNPGVYEMDVAYGISRAESKRLIKVFNESAWIGFLPALRDARSGVAQLVEHGYRFVCITSLSLDEKARMLRISNLKNIFGKDVFVDVVCLDTGADKDAALEPYRDSGLWWIEDKVENAECGYNLGLRCVLVAHEHNNKPFSNGIMPVRVEHWSEIADLIIGAEA
jgi:beta-phosphoglucomutase-like phosphatase (HAD superfamily)